MWGPILAALLSVLGPIIKKWLEDRLKAKAAEFEADRKPRAGDEPDAAALLRAVRAETWFFQVARRRFLDRAIADVPPAVAGRVPLAAWKRAELEQLAAAAG